MHSCALLVILLAVSVAGQNQGCPSGSGGQGPCSAALGIACPAGQFCIGDSTCCTIGELQPSTVVPPMPVAPTTCVDLVNPRTGISDCPNVAYLCNNAVYFQLMTQQCPRTCGRCSGTGTGTGTITMTCVDQTNPNTGRSDCPNVAYLCNNALYSQLMTQQCPRTCGRCSGKK